MGAFEALFAFYSLLLGLAIAAVATGFGEQWRRRRVQAIGVLVPLLGVYVLLATTDQWLSFYGARNSLAMNPINLLTCLVMALPYIFVAQVMFPISGEQGADGDCHYLTDRRILLGVLVMPLALSLMFNLIFNPLFFAGPDRLKDAASFILPVIVLMPLMFVRNRTWHVAGLTALILFRLAAIFS
ncbi:MAG TPA: hypothetical protein VL405_02655 [Sphingomonas sp.]|jgi:hypothetical protein|nr:hypothetical protein [Sphingomonas sp.]